MFSRNTPPPQPSGWDAFKLLNIPPSQPGTPRKCASFNQKGEPCGVGRPIDQRKQGDDILNALSVVDLADFQDNNDMLYPLAKTMLCHHHNSPGHVDSLIARWQKVINDECRRQWPRGPQLRPLAQPPSRKRHSTTSGDTYSQDSASSSPPKRHKHQAREAQSSSSDESETLDHEREEQAAGSGSVAVILHQRLEALGIRNTELEREKTALVRALKKATRQHNDDRGALEEVTRERDAFSDQVEEQFEEINGLKEQLERARGEDRESGGPESSTITSSRTKPTKSPKPSQRLSTSKTVPSKSNSAREGTEDVEGSTRDSGGLDGMGMRGGMGERSGLQKIKASVVVFAQSYCVYFLFMCLLRWSERKDTPSFYPAWIGALGR